LITARYGKLDYGARFSICSGAVKVFGTKNQQMAPTMSVIAPAKVEAVSLSLIPCCSARLAMITHGPNIGHRDALAFPETHIAATAAVE